MFTTLGGGIAAYSVQIFETRNPTVCSISRCFLVPKPLNERANVVDFRKALIHSRQGVRAACLLSAEDKYTLR